jgi:hypothetical protein
MVRHGQSIHGHHGSTESEGDPTILTDLPRERARFSIEGVGRNPGLLVVDSATTTTSCTGVSANSTTSANVSKFWNVRPFYAQKQEELVAGKIVGAIN